MCSVLKQYTTRKKDNKSKGMFSMIYKLWYKATEKLSQIFGYELYIG